MKGRGARPPRGQFGVFSSDHRVLYTRQCDGERFPDERPRVPDDIVERMAAVTNTQAWGVLRGD